MNEKKIKDVYDALQDEESRFIYGRRVLYSLTQDEKYLDDIVAALPEVQWLKSEILRSHENFLFGAGGYGKVVLRMAPGHWKGILDNDSQKWGGTSMEYKFVRRFGKTLHLEIAQQLADMGIDPARIIRVDRDVIERLEQKQYFDLPALYHAKDETFVDAGGYDGATSVRFATWAGEYRKIFAFEPDESVRPKCEAALRELSSEKTVVYPFGTWKEKGELHFSKMGPGCSLFSDDGEIRISVTSLDEVCKGEQITYIKMDVEGSELETLEGARCIIEEQHPKLAVCLYHKPQDIFEIPAFLQSIAPTYRFYLRHYSLMNHETILYAI